MSQDTLSPDLKKALQLLEAHPEEADFSGPAAREHIAEAEQALGVRLPPSYRHFLERLGAGTVADEEYFGIPGPEDEDVPDVVSVTLAAREDGLPAAYVVLAEPGYGVVDVLDTAHPNAEGECPVLQVELEVEGKPSRVLSPTFGAWLLHEVETALLDEGAEDED